VNTNKEKYISICKEYSIPVFSQPWWLDIVAGPKNWNVVVNDESGNFLSALPFVTKKVAPFLITKMPELTPSLNIWFNYPGNAKYSTRLTFEKEQLSKLISALPTFSRFHQKYNSKFTNWLPFFWQGYKQSTRYSYILEDLTDLEKVQQNFKKNNRYDIRKAAKAVEVVELKHVDEFLDINKLSFDRQNEKASYSRNLVHAIDRACVKHECRKILAARDDHNRIHAAIYLVWDDDTVYYLLGGGDPELRNSNANSLLVWHAIQFASENKKIFDFEGSMIEPIERFFRSFGAVQAPYFSIYKNRFPFQLLELR